MKKQFLALFALLVCILFSLTGCLFLSDTSTESAPAESSPASENTPTSGPSVPASVSPVTPTVPSDSTPEPTPTPSVVEYEIGEGVLSTFTNSLGTVWIKVGVPLKNTGNENLYLSSGTIDIEYADGSLADTISLVSGYPEVLMPGETAYFYEETTFEGTETTGLKAVPHIKAEKAKVNCIRLETSEVKISDSEYFGVKITGRVLNNTEKEQSMVYVVLNAYNAKGEFIGQKSTVLTDEIASGEKIGFEISSLVKDIQAADIATYEIYAFPYQFQF